MKVESALAFSFDLLFSYRKGVIFWPLLALYFSSYFTAIGTLLCVAMVLILVSLQYIRMFDIPRSTVPLANQTILITGGAHGVGRLLVETLHKKHNPKIIILDIISEPNYQLPNVFWYKCDVGDRRRVSDVAKQVRSEHGAPNIVINNAGIVKAKRFVDLTEDDIETVVRVNLMSSMWVLKQFIGDMIENKDGHVVSVASVLGLAGCGYVSDYCASKAGLIAFHESLRQELMTCKGIKFSCVYPGMINTGMFSGVKMTLENLTPPLETHEVSDAIVRNLENGVSADIKLPTYANGVGFIARTFPIEFCDNLREIIGANHEMASFSHSSSNSSQ